ncbi:hypothetical protein [Brumimicrobium oceani]|uniref:Uncharacterized protein n=1 Tax=Brumimicrobium oceani TaxID=2100725 RepID=A0A2U2XEG5_9FLAO|nr:hypothetical protein [Brumimicrobium oceani]PWH86184.1 hypothetical protein DIT68_06410 [Brumimicrobium oceani]
MKTKIKWYNKPQLVGTLLMFWPPFGLYGLYKSENIDSKFKIAICGAHILAIALLIWVRYN